MGSKEYMREYMRERRRKRRQQAIAYLGGKCSNCDATDELEINHIDRSQKSFHVSKAQSLDGPWERLQKELDKCNLLCHSCHLAYTAQQHESGEIQPWNKGLHGEYLHGTMRMYQDKKCRCESCREAKRQYRQKKISTHEQVNHT